MGVNNRRICALALTLDPHSSHFILTLQADQCNYSYTALGDFTEYYFKIPICCYLQPMADPFEKKVYRLIFRIDYGYASYDLSRGPGLIATTAANGLVFFQGRRPYYADGQWTGPTVPKLSFGADEMSKFWKNCDLLT